MKRSKKINNKNINLGKFMNYETWNFSKEKYFKWKKFKHGFNKFSEIGGVAWDINVNFGLFF